MIRKLTKDGEHVLITRNDNRYGQSNTTSSALENGLTSFVLIIKTLVTINRKT